MKQGNIVLLPFPFTDLSAYKLRPALLVATRPADVTVVFISSQIQHPRPADLLVQPSTVNGLTKHSLICTDKLATVERKLVKGELGDLEESYREQFNQKLSAALLLPPL